MNAPVSTVPTVSTVPARGRGRTAWRALSGVAVVALAGGAVGAAAFLPGPNPLDAPPLAVDVPPTQVALVCPAPVLTGGATGSDLELGGASDVTSALAAAVLARPDGTGTVTLGPLGGEGEAVASGSEAAVLVQPDPAGALILRGEPTSQAALAAAGLAQRATTGDLRGLAAAPCPSGTTTAWFAAGRTRVGSSTVLTLANPGSTPTTVAVRVWGPTGEVTIDRGEVVVAPGESIDQTIEALAPDLERLAILVSSRGGVIAASLQTADLDGLSAGGFDFVSATGGPATDVAVPGVVLGASTVDDEDASLVRIFNPGTEPAEVDLALVSADSVTGLGGDQGFVIDPGVVSDVSLAGAPAGTFTLRATSSAPIVVGASLVRVGQPDPADPGTALVDRAWLGSIAPVTTSVIALPGVGSLADRAVLVLAAPLEEGSAVTITSLGPDGSLLGTEEVSVPAGLSVALDVLSLDPGTAVLRLDSDSGISGAVVLGYSDELGDLITVVPAAPDPQVERTVRVAVTLG